ncbi:DUF7260 family protein [Haladaptatus cibarius]|uniref:DUF7260 family protein n=1 Tax=Haladaptatus cibarius TaxID=453847 RepID=UPI000678DEB4|nr:hypothetical protein [Haladaptatus cibarius]
MVESRRQLVNGTALPLARQLLRNEKSELQSEIKAFENFSDRLSQIPPQPCRTDGGTLTSTFQSQPSTAQSPQEAVRTAYRDTVLSVDHWKSTYGAETAIDSIAQEFGPDIATYLSGSSSIWSPLVWNQLRNASEEVVGNRQRTVRKITQELSQLDDLQNSLLEIDDELAAIERGHFSFTDRTDCLRTLQRELDQLVDDQQKYLHQREYTNGDIFSAFIYSDLDTDFPGLSALATTHRKLERIELRHWCGLL